MKKSIILILSAIFTILILFIPNNVHANSTWFDTLIVDYNDEYFQEFYSTNIEPRLDTIIERCKTRFGVDDILLGYTSNPFNLSEPALVCYNISQTDIITSYVNAVGTSYARLYYEVPNSQVVKFKLSDLSQLTTFSGYSTYSDNAFRGDTYNSDLSEFTTNFNVIGSSNIILFYSDKDIITFTNDNNENNGLFINGKYIQYGETITLYANSEKSFLPEDYDYIDYTENLEVDIPYIDVELSFPVLSDYVPYSFNYNSYFILDSNPDFKYYLDGSLYTVTNNYVGFTNDLLVLKKYTLYKNATYFFEIYDGNSLESSNLLQTETFYTGDIGTNFVGPGYIDNPNKDNTSNIIGGSIFSNFETSDYGFTSIITAPLRLINSFDTSVCTAPSIPILGTNFTLPCGQFFWGREDISEFKEIYQIIIYGILCYYIGIDIIRTIQHLKNPDDSKLNVIDL